MTELEKFLDEVDPNKYRGFTIDEIKRLVAIVRAQDTALAEIIDPALRMSETDGTLRKKLQRLAKDARERADGIAAGRVSS